MTAKKDTRTLSEKRRDAQAASAAARKANKASKPPAPTLRERRTTAWIRRADKERLQVVAEKIHGNIVDAVTHVLDFYQVHTK